MAVMAIGGAVTSVTIYASDLERLQSKQRKMAAELDRRVTLYEIIHELIDAVETAGEGA